MTQKYIVRFAAEREMLFKLIKDGNGNKGKLNRAYFAKGRLWRGR